MLRDALKEQELAAAASNAEKERIQQKLCEVEEKARRADQHRFALQWLGIFVVAVALVIFGLTFKGFSTKWIVVACVGTVIAWMWVAGNAGRKSAAVRDGRLTRSSRGCDAGSMESLSSLHLEMRFGMASSTS